MQPLAGHMTALSLPFGRAPEWLEDHLMWNLFNCYVSGRHDYGMWCEPGQIFLRCIHCGKRSSGWSVGAQDAPARDTQTIAAARTPARVVPFPRAATN